MKIHLIATGGSAMHNMALALHENGHEVTGSDDEIYNPAKNRLAKAGLLPKLMGWHPERIHKDLDAIILGMHARKDNPELLKAMELGLPIFSYPAYIYEASKQKSRVVVAGSHGKTTTTAMILHVLRYHKVNTDYLVGAQLKGFDTMVRLSDAPLIVLEGDEYLSSPLNRVPKIHCYHPKISIITGIAWDHVNVFPTFENYVEQFRIYIKMMKPGASLIYFEGDPVLKKLVEEDGQHLKLTAYDTPPHETQNYQTEILDEKGNIPLKIFGLHNLQNMESARYVCQELGLSKEQFYEAIQSFEGAAKRLETLGKGQKSAAYLDFAHAPSKVKATINALKGQFNDRSLVACLELHTFSSLNKDFLGEYAGTSDQADEMVLYYSEHTLKMKKLPPLSKEEVREAFQNPNLAVFTDKEQLEAWLLGQNWANKNLLLMTSGNYNGLDLKGIASKVIEG